MNQAMNHLTGDYVLYLNCGDLLYDNTVLENVAVAYIIDGYDYKTAKKKAKEVLKTVLK